METSGVIPHVKVAVDDLAAVATAPGPFVTVEMATPAERENAAQFSGTAWKSLRTQIEEQGAPAGALDLIEPLVPDAHLEGDGLIVVASAGRVHQVMHAADAPPRDVGRVAPLPTLTGVINARQATPTCVIVTTDRRGADLTVVASGVPVEGTEAGGADDPIFKSQP